MAGAWHPGQAPRLDKPKTWGNKSTRAYKGVSRTVRYSTCDILPSKVAAMATGVRLPASPVAHGRDKGEVLSRMLPPPSLKDRVRGTYESPRAGKQAGAGSHGPIRWRDAGHTELDVDEFWARGGVRGLGPDVPLDAPGGPMDADGLSPRQRGMWSLSQLATAARRCVLDPEVGARFARRMLWNQAYGGLRVLQDGLAAAMVQGYRLQYWVSGDHACAQVVRACAVGRRVPTASSPAKPTSWQNTLGELADHGCAPRPPLALWSSAARASAAPTFDPVAFVDSLNGYALWATFGEDILVAVALLDGILLAACLGAAAICYGCFCMRRKRQPLVQRGSVSAQQTRETTPDNSNGDKLTSAAGSANPGAMIAVGFMSGTSADGVDAAAVLTDGLFHTQPLATAALSFSDEEQQLIKGAMWQGAAGSGKGSSASGSPSFDASSPQASAARDIVTRGYIAAARRLSGTLQPAIAQWSETCSMQAVEQLVLSKERAHVGAIRRLLQDAASFSAGAQGLKQGGRKATAGDGDPDGSTAPAPPQAGGKAGEVSSPNVKLPGVLLGMHGQTLYHNPGAGRSVQVVDAPSVLETSGASAGVHSFRALDVMRGGQGAPLAPLFHAAIAVQAAAEGRPGVRLPLAVVNLGGVANITYVGARAAELVAGSASDASHGGAGDSLVGFDCGPGMALLDDELSAAACSLTGAASSSSPSSSGSVPRFDEGG